MSSIESQIDAAVPLQKERAAEFDHRKQPLDELVERVGQDAAVVGLLSKAYGNLTSAQTDQRTIALRYLVRLDLIDCMNLCALALSLLPEDLPASEAPF